VIYVTLHLNDDARIATRGKARQSGADSLLSRLISC